MTSASREPSPHATIALVLACLVLGLSEAWLSTAAAIEATEQQLKAAYVYNFLQYVEWPADARPAAGETLMVCALGRGAFDGRLDAVLSHRAVRGHAVVMRELADGERPTGCAAAVVSGAACGAAAERLVSLRQRGLLTIGDCDGFTALGGMIELHRDGATLRFRVDRAAASAAGLVLSSDLLQLATSVAGSHGDAGEPR